MRTLVFISSLHSGHLFLLLFFESSQKNIIQNGPHFRLERLPQQHQQCREARQASGLDPSFLEGHCQVLVLDAEAWYVSFNIFYVVFFLALLPMFIPPKYHPKFYLLMTVALPALFILLSTMHSTFVFLNTSEEQLHFLQAFGTTTVASSL